MPDVGDEETPYAAVDKFYDFWFAFKSWREFPHADEEDVEQAESREEKRSVSSDVVAQYCCKLWWQSNLRVGRAKARYMLSNLRLSYMRLLMLSTIKGEV